MASVINDPPHSVVAKTSQLGMESAHDSVTDSRLSSGFGPVVVFFFAALCWLPGLVAYLQTGSILLGLLTFGIELAIAAVVASLMTRFA